MGLCCEKRIENFEFIIPISIAAISVNEKKQLSFSICLPIYKASHVLKRCLDSILKQSFQNFEIIIGDNNEPTMIEEIEKTKKIIKSYNDQRILYFKNEKNLGYPKNLIRIVARAKNDILFLMASDDILLKNALQKTHDAFLLNKNIGVVTRPYFWFMDKYNRPVRAVFPYDKQKDAIISVYDDQIKFMKIFESVGQLSGLAYRRKYLEIPFKNDIFLSHIYPFAGILKKHKCVFLKDFTVAVGIKESQTRSTSAIYDQSPTESWLKMYKTVFSEKYYRQQREWGIKHITTNYLGLVQIKNYGKPGILFKEMKILTKNRWQNLFSLKFWFFTLGTSIVPRSILTRLVDSYKNRINARIIKKQIG